MRWFLTLLIVLSFSAAAATPEPDPEPVWVRMARTQLGVSEGTAKGRAKIRAYHKLGSGRALGSKSAWCASFMNWVLSRSGYRGTQSAWARSFERLGTRLEKPRPGCIVVFWRKSKKSGKGHVGIWLSETEGTIQVLGGNQDDKVQVSDYPKHRVTAYVWPERWGPF